MNNLSGVQIIPHEKAPLFSRGDWRLTFQQALSEVTSDNFQTTEEVREVLRQLGFVNMWFFLKFIAGFNGPYADLTDHFHMEMCNFYQQQMMIPGSRSGGFIFRSGFKSSVWTHGGNTFEINRNPNIRVGLGSGKIERAMSFMETTQRTFDDNKLFEWLYPENAVDPNSRRWSAKEAIHPSRTINHPEPTIQLITAGGSSAGIHVDLLKLDDIVGDAELDSEHMAGAEMVKRGNWLKSNTETLLIDWVTSRIFIIGTRYAVDDPYEFVMEDMKWCTPAVEELPYQVRDNGTYDVYYRMIKENGKITLPERFTEEKLQKLYEKDPWTYWSQYFNNPHKAQASDMSMYEFKSCWLDYEERDPVIILPGHDEKVYLSDCDVIQAIDPAASERKARASTSRSAQVVVATDHRGRSFFIYGHVDYVDPNTLWGWIAKAVKYFGKNLRMTGLEQQGAFKLLGTEFKRRAREDGILGSVHLRDVKTHGDKDARIRSYLQAPLHRGELYCVEGLKEKLQQELDLFPSSPRKDGLDASAMAMQIRRIPGEPLRKTRMKKMFKKQYGNTSSVTGY